MQQKRYERDGKENTDKTLNVARMIHATGFALDVNLVDQATQKELELWDKSDWPDGVVVDFYRHKTDAKSQRYQELQDLLVKTMLRHHFTLGTLREFWHFELLPENK